MKTYLFDFDGTLVDSMSTFASVMLKILDDHGIKYGDDTIKIITPLGYQGTAEYFQKLGINMPTQKLITLMIEEMKDEYTYRITAKDGVTNTLNELKEKGASLNILTASPHDVLDPCLKRLKIFDLFDNVWSCDDFKTTKANPEIYKMAAEKLGRRIDEIIFVDDNINAIKTAKLAGANAYGIFDNSSKDFIQDMKNASDRYIESFSELLTY